MEDLFSEVRAGLERTKGRWKDVAQKAHVSYSWVSKCGAGKYDNTSRGPSNRTLEKLAEVLRTFQ